MFIQMKNALYNLNKITNILVEYVKRIHNCKVSVKGNKLLFLINVYLS